MPRPGPRPYECVRRAWHSDRHQPMRGTLIQEIFRMANEMHDPATRKNKEWQEKLPAVVLKAEEIMYSKANSEAEYMDLKTLHDRANDAIDTIIRKDDSIESGDLLQPCIEAALNLGCIPRRASRSQRYSNPGCYLSPISKDVNEVMKAPECSRPNIDHLSQMTPGQGNTKISASQCPYWSSTMFKPINGISSIQEVKYNGADSYVHKDPGAKYECPFPSKSSFLNNQDVLPFAMESCSSPSLGRVYPLFYSDDQSETFSNQSLQTIEKTYYNAKAVFPCDQPLAKTQMVSAPDYNRKSNATASKENSILQKMPKNTGCDLSLQLGLPCATSLRAESVWANEHEDVGSNSSCDGSKFDPSHANERARNFESLVSPKDKGFGFELLDEPLESCSSKRSSGERIFYTGARDQKRKAPATGPFN